MSDQSPTGPAPQAPPPPPGQPSAGSGDDTVWVLLAYLGTLIVSFIAPLVVYLAKKRESRLIRHHSAQALNLLITGAVYYIAAVVIVAIGAAMEVGALVALGVIMYIVIAVSVLVFLILGSVKGARGDYYRIPGWACWNIVK